MRIRWLAILAFLAVCSTAFGQLSIPAKLQLEPMEVSWLEAKGAADDVAWVGPDGLKVFPSALMKDPRTVFIQAGKKEGTFRVYCLGVQGGKFLPQSVCEVTVGKGAPTPPPGPVDPPPPPPPTATGRKITVITDADQVDAKLAELLRSKTLREGLAANQHQLMLYEHTAPIIDTQGLRPLVNQVGLPALIVQQPTGQVIRGLRVPVAEATFLDACNH